MLHRRAFLASAIATISIASIPSAFAADFSWDGTWSGKFASGNKSVIKISKGKVISWSFKGVSQRITSSSVGAKTVKIAEAGGSRVTLTPGKGGTLNYSWTDGRDVAKKVLTKG